jgi:hypothetical protein
MNREEVYENFGKQVRLTYLTGGVHAEGTLICYAPEPTVIIETSDGRQISWLARIAEPITEPTTELTEESES